MSISAGTSKLLFVGEYYQCVGEKNGMLGLREEHAFESSQKYKEGKFIIELAHMVKDNQWEDGKKRKSI
ncbi:yippee putative zinc-binding protein [Ancylostoma caninum]|uniref:Yippee putative zinc-binding protein n=1 Tax=Ancylostoma caninum TaxID=29170 RepID=A0A368GQV3_ANCCA|nr:yippee putative zinc-binding protein [Ancylostoma caninum]